MHGYWLHSGLEHGVSSDISILDRQYWFEVSKEILQTKVVGIRYAVCMMA